MEALLVGEKSEFFDQAKNILKDDDRINVDVAFSLEKSLELIKEKEYGAIVSNYKLSDDDALKFLKDIRKKRGIETPFILLSIHNEEDIAKEALNLGADRYLQKRDISNSGAEILLDAILEESGRWRTEKKLEKSEREKSMILKNTNDNIAYHDTNHNIKWANKSYAKVAGEKEEELKGKKCYKIWLDREEPCPSCPVEKALETGEVEEKEISSPEQEKSWLIRGAPIKNKNDEITGAIETALDITERKKMEKDLKKSEEKYRNLFNSANVSILVHDSSGKITSANQEATKILEMTEEELRKKDPDFWSGKLYDEDINRMDVPEFPTFKIINSGKPIQGEVIGISTDENEDKIRWFLFNGSPQFDEEGNLERIITYFQEITERKKLKERLKKEQLQLETLLSNLPGMAYRCKNDENWTMLFVSEGSLELTGYEPDELIENKVVSYKELIHPEDRDKIREDIQKALDKKEPFQLEYRINTADGGEKWVWEQGKGIFEDNGKAKALEGIIIDITNRKKTELELQRSRKEYKELIDGMNDTAWVIGLDGNFLEVNEAAVEKLGYSREELLSMKPHDIDAELDPGEITNLIETMPEDEVQVFETAHRTKDGEKIPIEISSSLITYKGETAILSIARDITERKEHKKREDFLHSLLRHDVRNKTQIVEGYLELMEEFDLPEEAEKYLEKTKDAVEAAVDIIKKVRTLREIDEKEEIGRVSLDSMLENAINEYRNQISEKGFEIEYEKPGVEVIGGPLLSELFSNLIENSIRHSEGDKIKISMEESNEEITILLEDNGKGIPNAYKTDIFERGFKKGETAGSGLGMFMVKRIVEEYRGSIEVKDSELGGAKFEIKLRKA